MCILLKDTRRMLVTLENLSSRWKDNSLCFSSTLCTRMHFLTKYFELEKNANFSFTNFPLVLTVWPQKDVLLDISKFLTDDDFDTSDIVPVLAGDIHLGGWRKNLIIKHGLTPQYLGGHVLSVYLDLHWFNSLFFTCSCKWSRYAEIPLSPWKDLNNRTKGILNFKNKNETKLSFLFIRETDTHQNK